MSCPLYAITRWKDGEKHDVPDEDDLFDKIPGGDCEYVSMDEDGEDPDNLCRTVRGSIDGLLKGATVEAIGGEQGVKLTIPKGSILKFLQERLNHARAILGTGNNLVQEAKLLDDLAYSKGDVWTLADIFQNSYYNTLWYDEDEDLCLKDTIRYFGERMKDNCEHDSVFRVYCLYYHK